ncbi:MAG TPA: hypothetical protein VMX17_08455 [Candidatus Glassbacteria bacterium]|nr:hypothetical protein [Candidatus Glassbacteria bacterium]
MSLLETYLLYLSLQEREWNTPTENPDSFELKNFEDLLGQKVDLKVFKKMRHALQPSMYDLYIKNSLGDYMGRPDTMNSQTMRNVGFKEFQKDIESLKKKMKYAEKIKDKFPDNFFTGASQYGEMNDPGGDDGDGGDGGDGGGDGGGGL